MDHFISLFLTHVLWGVLESFAYLFKLVLIDIDV